MIDDAPAHTEQTGEPLELPWSKLHPLTPVMQGGLAFVVIVGIIIANLRDRLIGIFFGQEWPSDEEDLDPITAIVEQGLIVVALLVVLGIILVIIGITWLSWRFHSYRITGENVEMKQGILFRKHRRAPLMRIQAVNLQRPLLARMLGLAKLEVKTAGQDGDLMLAYLSHAIAKTVRNQILESAYVAQGITDEDDQASGGADTAPAMVVDFMGQVHEPSDSRLEQRTHDFVDADVDAESERAGSLVRIPLGRLIGSVVLSNEAVILVLAFIAIPIFALNTDLTVLASLIPVIIVFASMMISRFNRGFNFTISKTRDGVRTGSGLTSTYTESIPLRRFHSVDVSQPWPWRFMGWWRIRATTGGNMTTQNNQNMFQNIVLPVGTIDDVHRVLGLVLPTYNTPEDSAMFSDAIVGSAEGFTHTGPRAKWLYWLQHRRFALTIAHPNELDATILMRRGRLVRRLTITPVVRVQSIEVRRSPLLRLAQVSDVRVHTVTGPVIPFVQGIANDDAQTWFDRLAHDSVEAMRADQHPGRR